MGYSFGRRPDADVNAFVRATEITDTTQRTAIHTLVTDLKAAGIWTKMKAIYPFVGGTASTHKWNLKDPRDVDAAFRLQFNGGWTHSSTGALPNGTTGYANTYFSPSTQLTDESSQWSLYSRSNVQGAHNDFGAFGSGTSNALACASRWLDNNLYADSYATSTNRVAVTNTDSRGFFNGNRTTATSHKIFRNGLQIGNTNTTTSAGRSTITGNVLIASYGNTSSSPQGNYSTREYAFFSFGDGLTDSEASSLYTIVQSYQTTLGRQV